MPILTLWLENDYRHLGDFEGQYKRLISEKQSCLELSCLVMRDSYVELASSSFRLSAWTSTDILTQVDHFPTLFSLQRAYGPVILNDWGNAEQDVESNMWKLCFYKPIEEWRKKIRSVRRSRRPLAPSIRVGYPLARPVGPRPGERPHRRHSSARSAGPFYCQPISD